MPTGKKRVVRRVRKYGGRKVIKRVRKAPRKKLSLASMVKALIHKNAENKQAYITCADTSLLKFNSGVNTTADMIQVMPNISQSTSDNGRIGDQIRAQRHNIRGYVKLDVNTSGASNYDLCNVVCRLMVVSLKTKPNYTEATSAAAPLSGLLKKGGTTTGFYGNLSDIYAPINSDLWTVHADKKFYLSQDAMTNFNSTTNAIVGQDISKTVKFFNLNIRCKNRLLKYDANVSSALLPTNYGPILLLGYAFLNGATADVVNTRVGLQFDSTFSYEDA